MSKHVAIIVLNWNGKEDTRKCLISLQALTYPHIEIFIIDNGSTDGSKEVFRKEFPTLRLIETKVNLGYAGGNNVGIEIALKEEFDFVFVLNNDTVVDPGIVEAFLSGFSEEKVGILGAKIYRMDEPNRLDHLGGLWNPKKIDFDYVGYRAIDGEEYSSSKELDYVCGAALMMRREVLEKVGLFDPRFFLFWEEADFCFRARRAGFLVKNCPEAKVWHKISASFTGGKPHAAYFVWRGRLLWIEKNFSGVRRFFYFARLLGGKFSAFFFSKQMRKVQLLLQKCAGKDTQRNKVRIQQIDAALCGMEDYLFKRFYAGRSKNFMNCD
ncbi:MAG: N-acetylglucosaminyl-diphospho-decaprenol L-rhamnosyltransferase [Chlamydiae bacterium]|nr:N-acetylglucosaminyl-diphospho-decaprenol L-rhamnosyltransferase [Chlamydiota bacterium]